MKKPCRSLVCLHTHLTTVAKYGTSLSRFLWSSGSIMTSCKRKLTNKWIQIKVQKCPDITSTMTSNIIPSVRSFMTDRSYSQDAPELFVSKISEALSPWFPCCYHKEVLTSEKLCQKRNRFIFKMTVSSRTRMQRMSFNDDVGIFNTHKVQKRIHAFRSE